VLTKAPVDVVGGSAIKQISIHARTQNVDQVIILLHPHRERQHALQEVVLQRNNDNISVGLHFCGVKHTTTNTAQCEKVRTVAMADACVNKMRITAQMFVDQNQILG